MRIWAPLRKAEEQDDGTLKIEGIASTESVDAAGEIITAAAIKAALPDFMRHGGSGPLREMHQLSAAGRVDSADVGVDGVTTIKATVVDETAMRKVRLGVYRGLSVGGRATKRDPKNPKIVTALALTEISLVDRPANPDAVISLWKIGAPLTLDAETVKAALAAVPPLDRALILMKAVHAIGGREISARV